MVHLFAPWDASGATKKNSIRSYFLVHLTRLELAHPKALPPQGSVYTNFTTGAYGYYNIFFRYGEKNLEIIPILWAARFFGILTHRIENSKILLCSMGRDFWNFSSKIEIWRHPTFYGVRFLKVFFTDQLIISLKRSSPETRCWSAEKARTFLFIKYGKLDW